ncbi:hypothetical protein [Cupriavidus taiwanensis]|uniref:hypothetical protein n=1 Tax=Cupriavidus taiwanensis TaxID=164546 RepID=UPI000E17F0F2|nr:hypothetical protein [Cupriavidus taiwanensis]SPA44641.1 hypothetical protein CBM2629_A150443 [Cupriavidus taiwanensis]
MTAIQCAERQVAHANLMRELVDALERITGYAECQVSAFSSGRPYIDMTMFPSLCAAARAVLARAKEQQ